MVPADEKKWYQTSYCFEKPAHIKEHWKTNTMFLYGVKYQYIQTGRQVRNYMQWSELWDDGHMPSYEQIREFTDTPLWDGLTSHLHQTYHIKPTLFYSSCSMQQGFWKGWNVKYKKSGKALCTLYPKEGYFVALIAVGSREIVEADLLMPLCDAYTRNLYYQTEFGTFGKSLAIEVTSENILRDVKDLIALRVSCR